MRGLRWLVIRIAVLWIMLAVAVSGAILIGRRQPIPDRIALLHLNDCELPCWIGIVPGKTTLGETQDRIKQVYGAIPGYELRTTDLGFALTSQTQDDEIIIRLTKCDDYSKQAICNEIDISQYNPSG